MQKLKEYAKAVVAFVATTAAGVIGAATEAIETELPGVKAAVTGLVVAVLVAVTRNLKPATPSS